MARFKVNTENTLIFSLSLVGNISLLRYNNVKTRALSLLYGSLRRSRLINSTLFEVSKIYRFCQVCYGLNFDSAMKSIFLPNKTEVF